MTKQAILIEQVEALVDKNSLFDVLSALELMCYEKAEHLRTNWQDEADAKVWDRDASKIKKALEKGIEN